MRTLLYDDETQSLAGVRKMSRSSYCTIRSFAKDSIRTDAIFQARDKSSCFYCSHSLFDVRNERSSSRVAAQAVRKAFKAHKMLPGKDFISSISKIQNVRTHDIFTLSSIVLDLASSRAIGIIKMRISILFLGIAGVHPRVSIVYWTMS